MVRLNCFLLIVLALGVHSAQANDQNWLYSVRPGDTLWDLCNKYTTKRDCWLTIGAYNGVSYPRRLPPGLIIRFPIDWLKEIPKPVEVSYFNGDVRVKSTSNPDARTLILGEKLAIGSTIITGESAFVGLLFGDGSLVRMESNSELVLDSLSVFTEEGIVDSRLRLRSGAVSAKVPERVPKSRFQITTPAAIAAVRGTEFRVSTDDTDSGAASMAGEVFGGLVAVAAASDEVDVAAGYGIKTTEGEALAEPEQLLPAPQVTLAQLQHPPLTIDWLPMAQAQEFRVELYSLAEGELDELLDVVAVSSTESGFTDASSTRVDGCFAVIVRAVSATGLLGLGEAGEVCLTNKLDAPQLSGKKLSFASSQTTIELDWSQVFGADSYTVQLSASPSFGTLVAEYTSSETRLDLSAAELADDHYYYRVLASGPDRVDSDYSEPRKLVRQDEPYAALTGWAIFWVLLAL